MFGDTRRGGGGFGSGRGGGGWAGNRRREKEEKGKIAEGLGARLAGFKHSPIMSSGLPERMFFEGACELCAPLSRGTLSSSLVKQSGLAIALRPSISRFLWPHGVSPPDNAKNSRDQDQTQSSLVSELVKMELVSASLTVDPLPESISGVDAVASLVTDMKLIVTKEPDTWSYRLSQHFMLSSLSPSGVIYHPGQVEILRRCQRTGNPMVFIPGFQGKSDLLLVNAFLEECLDIRARIVLDRPEDGTKGGGTWNTMRAFSLLQDTSQSLSFAVERSVILFLLKRGDNLIFHLQKDKGCGPTAFILEALDHFLEMVQFGNLEDILIVPVSIGYEIPPEKTSLDTWSVQKSERLARISFDQPFSLQGYVKNFTDRLFGRACDNRDILNHLSSHVLTTTTLQTRIMCTEIVAFILVYDKGSHTEKSLETRFDEVRDSVITRRRDIGFSGENKDAVRRGLRLLKDHVHLGGGETITAKSESASRHYLAGLAESVVSLYAMEAIVVTSLLSEMRLKVPLANLTSTHCKLPVVDRSSLIRSSGVLYHFLGERFFLVHPCRDVTNLINDTIDRLVTQEVIEVSSEDKATYGGQHAQDQLSRRLARQFDMECGEDEDERRRGGGGGETLFTVSLSPEAESQIARLCSLIRQHVDIFRRVVCHFSPSNTQADIDCIVERIACELREERDRIDKVVRQCLLRLDNMGVLYHTDQELVSMTEEWIVDEERLKELNIFAQTFAL